MYNNYRILAKGSWCTVNVAIDDPSCITRQVIRQAFEFAFEGMGLSCLRAECKDPKVSSLLLRLGFKPEGVARRAADGVKDLHVYSMLPEECRCEICKEAGFLRHELQQHPDCRPCWSDCHFKPMAARHSLEDSCVLRITASASRYMLPSLMGPWALKAQASAVKRGVPMAAEQRSAKGAARMEPSAMLTEQYGLMGPWWCWPCVERSTGSKVGVWNVPRETVKGE